MARRRFVRPSRSACRPPAPAPGSLASRAPGARGTSIADLRHALSPIGELELEVGKIDRASEVIRQTSSTLRADLIGRIDKLQTSLTT